MNPELERIWPDPDRRDVALEKIMLRINGKRIYADRMHRPDKGTVAYIARKAEERIRGANENA